MTESFRGGNSRLLARQLDLLSWPIVVLDQRPEIIYVSAAMCQLLQVDATRLVGLHCTPQVSSDMAIERELTMALAPPSEVLHGRAAVRHIPWPPKQPTSLAGQAFLPLIDEDPSTGLILVLFGDSDILRQRLLPLGPAHVARGKAADEVLLRLRSQWQHLDGLWPLLGDSPPIQLAMRRMQMAVQSPASLTICGAAGSGKAEIARAIFALRGRSLDLPASTIHALPIDCSVANELVIGSMLESLSARWRPGIPSTALHLLLERVEYLKDSSAAVIDTWLVENSTRVSLIATSELVPEQIAARSALMSRLVHQFNTLVIEIPPLAVRREDVAPLAQHNLAAAANRIGRRLPAIAPQTMELMEAYAWPGNAMEVRQVASEMLNNAVLTATIQPTHLPLQVRTYAGTLAGGRQSGVEPIDLDAVLMDLERIMLQRAIKISPRNRARAARLLGISRPRFLRRISQLGLDDRPTSEEE